MFSTFYKKQILIKQPLRDFIIRLTNDSVKRKIEYNGTEIQNTPKIVSPFLPDNSKQPANNVVPFVVVFLSVSSVCYYFYWFKK